MEDDMGSFSLWHLLMLAALVAIPFVSIKLLTRLSTVERWIARLLERRILYDRPTHAEIRPSASKLWWLPLPVSLISTLALLGGTVVTVLYLEARGNEAVHSAASALDTVAAVLAVACILLGVAMHFAGGRRRLKYELLTAGVSVEAVTFFVSIAQGLSFLAWKPSNIFESRPENFIEPAVFAWVSVSYVVLLVLARILPATLLGNPNTEWRRHPPSLSTRRAFHWVKRFGIVFAFAAFFGMTQAFLLAYLITRYVLGERMTSVRILYLRSFHYAEGPTAFGAIVARVASRFGVLLALVHQTQQRTDVHAKTRLTERAELFRVPDESWQRWILDEMQCASLVIIDRSVSSEGLSWEVEQALTLLSPEKLILLTKRGVSLVAPPGAWTLEYDLDASSARVARRTLERRLRAVMLQGLSSGRPGNQSASPLATR
jgi:hypothetical protein